jgi:hypothetical protein
MDEVHVHKHTMEGRTEILWKVYATKALALYHSPVSKTPEQCSGSPNHILNTGYLLHTKLSSPTTTSASQDSTLDFCCLSFPDSETLFGSSFACQRWTR